MRASALDLTQLILTHLAGGEMRLLVLVMGIRKRLGVNGIKGDLSASVRAALRKLIAMNRSWTMTGFTRSVPSATQLATSSDALARIAGGQFPVIIRKGRRGRPSPPSPPETE